MQADRMELHRAVMRGTGFYDWMTSPVAPGLHQEMADLSLGTPAPGTARPPLRQLPVVSFLAVDDERFAGAVLEELLPADRVPFRAYLENRPLGIGGVVAVSFILQRLRDGHTARKNDSTDR